MLRWPALKYFLAIYTVYSWLHFCLQWTSNNYYFLQDSNWNQSKLWKLLVGILIFQKWCTPSNMNIWFLGYFDKSSTTIVNTYKDWMLRFLNNPKYFQVFMVIIVENGEIHWLHSVSNDRILTLNKKCRMILCLGLTVNSCETWIVPFLGKFWHATCWTGYWLDH